MPLCRHRSLDGQHRVFTNSRQSPPGYALEYELGASSKHHLAGTVQLIAAASGFRTDADLPLQPGEQSMGFVETSSILPLLDQVHVATHKNGQTVLVSGWDDPLLPMVELVQLLGFIEPSPIRPRPHPFANNSLRVMNALNRRDTELIELEGLRSRAAIQESQIDALWSRVNGIHASIPGRIYHFLAWLPGLKRLLLVRPPKPKDEPESLP